MNYSKQKWLKLTEARGGGGGGGGKGILTLNPKPSTLGPEGRKGACDLPIGGHGAEGEGFVL